MTQPKVFQFKIPKRPKPDMALNRPVADTLVEQFVGEINGLPASDLEERWARSAAKAGHEYEFRTANIVGRNLPGEVELDFLMYINPEQPQPVQIDGEIGHKTAAQKSEDAAKDALLDEELAGYAAPVIRIDGETIQTQADCDRVYNELFG